MKLFLTGATGYIGSVVAEKLQQAGHQVAGLARSTASAEILTARGIEVILGDLNDAPVLAAAARAADGVIHAAFKHEGTDFGQAVEVEQRAVWALLSGLAGSGKPFLLTSGTAVLGDTGTHVFDEQTPLAARTVTSADSADAGLKALLGRLAVEDMVLQAAGVRGIVLRPPNVYGRSDGHAVLALLRGAAQALGAVPYATGTADHQWSFVHVDDLADLYLLALDNSPASELYHAGAEPGLRTKGIAEAVSFGLGLAGRTVELDLPALGEALRMPPLAAYWASNSQSSSEKARRVLGWQPRHTQMLADVAQPAS
ncbi:NAD-dependent epimerase/dehydratase family protein [Hymenobacter sp. YC55]|uniref:NAD-dependent epimerase/dehydratase family protein n=1 Tax=Hymenobacter sp. YC55 TaxID=3034019 RepID=UPI0023F6A007|nr:NAD-dependent epimerase/dehydratase family protein [Hymenobacter sp. YC55]MDF7815243.1 NAD-dependent epimerase/dehydratase family protein [Hymenobacter sp. YC55]